MNHQNGSVTTSTFLFVLNGDKKSCTLYHIPVAPKVMPGTLTVNATCLVCMVHKSFMYLTDGMKCEI